MSSRSLLTGIKPFPLFLESCKRLAPWALARNPVMMVVAIGTVITFVFALLHYSQGLPWRLEMVLFLILLATVLFANGAEALAESRGRAHANSLRETRQNLTARRRGTNGGVDEIGADALRRGDLIEVAAGELIPADGEIVEGAATINESAITGESAPVLREAGTDNSGVSAGTKVLTDPSLYDVVGRRVFGQIALRY